MTSSTANTDSYLWVGPSSGSWSDPANWQDQTTSAAGVPNWNNPVQFGTDTTSQLTLANDTVTGRGWSASLGLYGNLTLTGIFRTYALDLYLGINPSSSYFTSASLTVTGAGNNLQSTSAHAAGNLAVNDGAAVGISRNYEIASGRPFGNSPDYQFDGIGVDGAGSRVTIGGLLSTDDASHLLVTRGGYLEARRMSLDNTYGVAGYQVDAQSTIEVGTLGTAAAGTWTVDAGRTLTIGNRVQLNAPEFVVNGVIDDVGGLDLQGSPGNVTGSGTIRLENNAPATIGQSGSQLNVMFLGSNASLDLADGAGAFSSTIRRFAAGDSIQVSGATFDGATWQANVLSLFNGTTLVGTLKMVGKYSGDTFSVSNNVISLDTPSSSSTAAEKDASTTSRSVQLFTQSMASFERHTSALHELSNAVAPQGSHAMLASAH